jgi:hypothetical protein
MGLPKDFREFIELAISMNLKFVIVGGWAFNRYVEPRVTGDIDFFVESSPASERLVRQLLEDFGFGSVLPSGPILNKDVIMLGRAPQRIDLLTKIDGVTFEEAWKSREYEVMDGLRVPYISRDLLLRNKQSTGRAKDQLDAIALMKNAADHEAL